MASQRYALLLATILITICLDVSPRCVATAAAVLWNPKISRYVGSSYDLDKGPVSYEAYYPGTRDAYQKKRYFGGVGNTVLETSFQMPSERLAYSAETADHPISINGSFVVADNEETSPREQREAIASRRNYDARTTNQFGSFSNERSTIFDDEMNENSQVANIEEISKLVRRAISRELENWNALEGDLDRAIHQDRPMPQLGMRPRERHKDSEDDSYVFPVNRGGLEDSSLARKLDAHNGRQRSTYYDEGLDATASTMTNEMRVGGMRAVDAPRSPINVISDSSPPENIFQSRPQLLKYVFFKRPVPPRLDRQTEKAIEESASPGISDDNLVQFGGEITADNRGRRIEDVRVTSIEISDVPRHKTRHHHGEWPKRDYSVHRHRSPTANYSMTAS